MTDEDEMKARILKALPHGFPKFKINITPNQMDAMVFNVAEFEPETVREMVRLSPRTFDNFPSNKQIYSLCKSISIERNSSIWSKKDAQREAYLDREKTENLQQMLREAAEITKMMREDRPAFDKLCAEYEKFFPGVLTIAKTVEGDFSEIWPFMMLHSFLYDRKYQICEAFALGLGDRVALGQEIEKKGYRFEAQEIFDRLRHGKKLEILERRI